SIGDQGTNLFRQGRSELHQERDHDHRQRFDAPLDGDQDLPARQGRAAGLARSGLRRGQRACRDRRAELFPERRWLSDAGAKGPGAARLEIFPETAKLANENNEALAAARPCAGAWEDVMASRSPFASAVAAAVVLGAAISGAQAHDESKYPAFEGAWARDPGPPRYDPSRPDRRGQQPPLKPEYQAIFEASLADQALGGQGNNHIHRCIPVGMPRPAAAR